MSEPAAHRLALVLFGPPGSGKGTQAGYLMDALGIPQVSTGEMLRENIRLETPLGREVEARMRAGQLVEDGLVNELVRVRLLEPDCANGVILDGFPRTVDQARVLLGIIEEDGFEEVVIHLVVDYNVIIARIAGRRQCPVCGTLYNAATKPSKIPGVCDLEGARLVVRDDDREEVVRKRLEQYEEMTAPLIAFFKQEGRRVVAVEASTASPEQVFERIMSELSVMERAS